MNRIVPQVAGLCAGCLWLAAWLAQPGRLAEAAAGRNWLAVAVSHLHDRAWGEDNLAPRPFGSGFHGTVIIQDGPVIQHGQGPWFLTHVGDIHVFSSPAHGEFALPRRAAIVLGEEGVSVLDLDKVAPPRPGGDVATIFSGRFGGWRPWETGVPAGGTTPLSNDGRTVVVYGTGNNQDPLLSLPPNVAWVVDWR